MIDFIGFLKTLKPEDWNKKATPNWTVKDVVAHMVGWERGDVEVIRKSWETKTPPWWKNDPNYDEFNKKWVEYYKDYTPEQLIAEWEMWQKKVTEEVDKIGYSKIKTRPDLFDWLIEGDDKKGDKYTMTKGGSHYEHHYRQIKKALGNDSTKV